MAFPFVCIYMINSYDGRATGESAALIVPFAVRNPSRVATRFNFFVIQLPHRFNGEKGEIVVFSTGKNVATEQKKLVINRLRNRLFL
ncbi:hypothetical protein [Glaciimonas sp. GG7]